MAEGTNGNGIARISAWVSLAGIGVVVFGAIMTLFWTANSANSKADELQHRVDQLTVQAADERTQITQLCASLVEIETQFRGSDIERNLTHANDLRTEAMLWRKAFGVDLPISNAYYPSIAQDRPSPCR